MIHRPHIHAMQMDLQQRSNMLGGSHQSQSKYRTGCAKQTEKGKVHRSTLAQSIWKLLRELMSSTRLHLLGIPTTANCILRSVHQDICSKGTMSVFFRPKPDWFSQMPRRSAFRHSVEKLFAAFASWHLPHPLDVSPSPSFQLPRAAFTQNGTTNRQLIQ